MKHFDKKIFMCLLGSFILAFGLFNIHAQSGITEGGELGLELLLLHWFNISPAYTAILMDIIFYSIGAYLIGLSFVKYAFISTLSYSVFYRLLEFNGYILPDLTNMPLLAALIGALFVGVGVGIVVKCGGACGSDDAFGLVMSKSFNIRIEYSYFITDMIVLLLSLSYIPFSKIIYCLLSVCLSSFIIGKIQKLSL